MDTGQRELPSGDWYLGPLERATVDLAHWPPPVAVGRGVPPLSTPYEPSPVPASSTGTMTNQALVSVGVTVAFVLPSCFFSIAAPLAVLRSVTLSQLR